MTEAEERKTKLKLAYEAKLALLKAKPSSPERDAEIRVIENSLRFMEVPGVEV